MLENERVGGPRQYTGAESLGQLLVWRCPGCGKDNQTPFAEGCPQCGTGKPGAHVGVDPVVTPEERARILAAQNKQQPTVKTETRPFAPSEVDQSFARWLDARCDEDGNPAGVRKHENLLREAFYAGYRRGTKATTSMPDLSLTEPAPEASDAPAMSTAAADEQSSGPAPFPPGQIKERTLLAALRFFRTQILPEAGEEVATGEWLAVADVDAWIVELEKELAQ